MPVPAQVKQQTENLEKLHQEIYPPGNSQNDGAPVSDITATGDTSDGKGSEDFEQKWKTLQGMYEKSNSMVSQLTAENQNMNLRLSNTETLLGSINQNQNRPAVVEIPQEVFVTDKDVEEYGEDVVDIMRRVSKEGTTGINKQISDLSQAVNQLQSASQVVASNVQHVSEKQDTTSNSVFYRGLTELVPDWQATNDDPDFKQWLLGIDPLSGVSRQTYLADAEQQLDHTRVAGFFSTWNNVNGATNNAPKPVQNNELQSLRVPGRGSNDTTNVKATTTDSVSPAQIQKFYADVTAGRYKGRDAERDGIEKTIINAAKNGLVQ